MELYTIHEATSDKFYQTPKDLFNNPCYRYALTSDAKLVYSLLRDRMDLSRKNNWVNEKGEIFLLYTKEEIAELLGVSSTTVYKAFKALKACELIKQEQQGLNKPNKIYIGKIDYNFSIASKPELSRICEICRSRHSECEGQDIKNMNTNDTDSNKTDKKETNNLYVINHDDPFIDIYLDIFNQFLGKKHMRVSKENLEYIDKVMEVYHSYGIEQDKFRAAVVEYFETLPPSNNGSILAFFKASKRIFDIDLNAEL